MTRHVDLSNASVPKRSKALQSLEKRSWITAEALYDRCCNEATRRRIAFIDTDEQAAVARMHETLTGVSQAIEAELPIELRRAGTATFRMDWHDDDQANCGWERAPSRLKFNLQELFIDCAALLGQFPPRAVEIFVKVCAYDLRHGEVILPGFRRIEGSTIDTTLLQWLPPTLEAEWELIRDTAAGQS